MQCDTCDLEMLEAKSCIFTPIAFGEEEFDPIPYAPDDDHRCHDCGTMPGGFHHPGCDMERCPKCSGQLISCGCLSSDD